VYPVPRPESKRMLEGKNLTSARSISQPWSAHPRWKKTENSLSTDEAHQQTGVAALLGHTGHTGTNGVSGVSVCHTFFRFFFHKKMGKNKNKAPETKPSQTPHPSKQKASRQQSVPLASTEFVTVNVFVK
jgi:hypothetical protein